jgi:tetratricopeptide (TPR) repeat protein
MRENLCIEIHDPELVYLLTNFGLVYVQLRKYNQAFIYHTRALKISLSLFPSGHVTITECFIYIGNIYREMEDYTKAFKYFEKALKNQNENSTKGNLLRLAQTYDHMGVCLCNKNDLQTGMEYRMKAIRLLG